jgi:hypothetical protein
MDITDPLRGEGADRIAPTHEVVRVVHVEALHAAGRSSTDETRQDVQGIPARPVIGLGRAQRLREVIIYPYPLAQSLHHPRRFEPSDGGRRTAARQPEQRRERLTVDEWEGFDNRRQPAPTPMGDANVTTQTAAELPLDRRAIFRVQLEVQPSLFRTFRLMSA